MKTKSLPLALSVLTALSLLTLPTASHAADPVHIVIDGVVQTFDVAPYVKNDRTYIPLRGVLEKLGAHVFWNEILTQVIVKKGNTFVTLMPDQSVATVNGAVKVLDAPPELQNERTMIPLRFLVEALGADVKWDGNTNTVSITSTPEPITTTKQFNMYMNDPVLTIAPAFVTNEYKWNLLQQLYEGLTHVDEQGKAIPGVAESWETSDDGLTWTFHLRESAKWSDGSPVIASDFETGWKQAIDIKSESPLSFLFDEIQGVHSYHYGPGALREVGIHATDDRTLTVKLEHPMPWFPLLTAEPIFSPQKNQFADGKTFSLTNGPFSIQKWFPYFDMQMEKSATYWDREHVQLDQIHVQLTPAFNDEFLYTLYEGGAIDEMPLLLAQYDALKNNRDYQMVPEPTTSYLIYNESNPALKNAKIRRAFSYAIDPSVYTSTLFQGRAKPAVGLVPSGVSDGSGGGDFRQHAGTVSQSANHDAEVKQLLADGLREAGLTQLPPLTFTIEQSDLSEQIAAFLTKQWHDKLGIDVKINLVSATDKYRLQDTRKYDICFNTWGADYNDPMTFLGLFSTNGIDNKAGYSNPAYDALLKQANAERKASARSQLLVQAEQLVLQDAAVTPLTFREGQILIKPYVRGFHYVGKGRNFDLKNVTIQGK
ncbi:ABC transporter substrate-binding protein [Tumebacillus permanentifrigoris]|uniref:Oligopeptide transport system substrate-binding protein n=1 Tax=Tumebacillus permanentifrigoris TaxID=378543 RepID=A0A316D6Q3_9BACL|nr:ABC transporter substrate-binding protein [Tumebacillus permanentifrigoris]PWK07900.1 oligopeptide transport system substrate-binding protein [Tumebacillus permanentifrigoris]